MRLFPAALAKAGCKADRLPRREGADGPYRTDEGNFILDLPLGTIPDPALLDTLLNRVPGVVETGLFCAMATEVIIGREDGTVEHLKA